MGKKIKTRVVIIFGEPGAGKTWLSHKLDLMYYNGRILHLDLEYIDFIRLEHPRLYLEDMGATISQHYRTVFGSLVKKGDEKWCGCVTRRIRKETRSMMPQGVGVLIVEGYLAEAIPWPLVDRVKKFADVDVIYVKDRRYFQMVDRVRV